MHIGGEAWLHEFGDGLPSKMDIGEPGFGFRPFRTHIGGEVWLHEFGDGLPSKMDIGEPGFGFRLYTTTTGLYIKRSLVYG
jgi:hypothetical protein